MSDKITSNFTETDSVTFSGIANRIAFVVKQYPSKSIAAKYAGVEVNTLARWSDEKHSPNPSLLNVGKLLEGANISMDWLMTGHGDCYLPGKGPYPDQSSLQECHGRYEVFPLEGEPELDEPAVMHLPVTLAELSQRGLSREQVGAYILEDNALAPLFDSNDVLLVDHHANHFFGTSLYLVEFHNERLVRRLQRTVSGLTLLCDTHLLDDIHIPEEVLDQVTIIGKVIWRGGWL